VGGQLRLVRKGSLRGLAGQLVSQMTGALACFLRLVGLWTTSADWESGAGDIERKIRRGGMRESGSVSC
jgi:hypothetical protein